MYLLSLGEGLTEGGFTVVKYMPCERERQEAEAEEY